MVFVIKFVVSGIVCVRHSMISFWPFLTFFSFYGFILSHTALQRCYKDEKLKDYFFAFEK